MHWWNFQMINMNIKQSIWTWQNIFCFHHLILFHLWILECWRFGIMKIVIHSEVDWKFGLLESYNQFFVVDFVCVPSMKEPHYICPNDKHQYYSTASKMRKIANQESSGSCPLHESFCMANHLFVIVLFYLGWLFEPENQWQVVYTWQKDDGSSDCMALRVTP